MGARRHGLGEDATGRVAVLEARARHAARTSRLQTITAALSRAVTREEVARTLVERAMTALGADEGGLWTVAPGESEAHLAFGTGFPPERAARWEHLRVDELSQPLADALRRGEPVFARSRRDAAGRWPGAVDAVPGEFAFAVLPLEAEGRVAGAACFVFHDARRFDYEEQVFLVVLARLAAQALLRAQAFEAERAARAEAEGARQRATFLAEASALLSSSLDWEAALASVARLAVPAVADWCAVDAAEELAAGAPPVAIAHLDPAEVERALAWRRRWPPDPAAPSGVTAVIRTGRSELYEDVDESLRARAIADPERLRRARELGMTSAMIVPLSARGRTLGAITFVTAESRRRYGAADRAMAEELGRRAGIAVDNARLYQDAQRAVRARDEVLAVVSHDLKNPLESVLLSASLLLRAPDPAQVRRYAETIHRSATRMDRLIRELLDLSRMDAGRFTVELRPERLEGLVDEALALLAPVAQERGVTLAASGPPLADAVPCDRERVLQVLSNLVGNAVSFSPRGGRVAVTLALGEREARVEVRDEGPGIPAEDLPHVFDRFWKSRSSGTGLGLAIAKGIVDAHGGCLRVESRVGEGSAFAFTLPRGS
jgi:signal transduction histidine kinase